jgi:hypothetical protein
MFDLMGPAEPAGGQSASVGMHGSTKAGRRAGLQGVVQFMEVKKQAKAERPRLAIVD